jgi:hypothetical protein
MICFAFLALHRYVYRIHITFALPRIDHALSRKVNPSVAQETGREPLRKNAYGPQ